MATKVFAVRRSALSMGNIPHPAALNELVGEYEVIRETARGKRVKIWEGERNLLDMHFEFFDSRLEALEHLADKANAIAGVLEDQKLQAVKFLCECHDQIRAVQCQ
ncbi:TPA: hypothetical protein JG832_002425 [Enterobacter hormaechei subsp. xiangfangensis]|nr:hypothetical protein [Enterobacter hormaechei subsp. xiangfangensis]HAV1890561.1 hypothetical protein [Enterobacter hormaechei subsp. xiangfangensis]